MCKIVFHSLLNFTHITQDFCLSPIPTSVVGRRFGPPKNFGVAPPMLRRIELSRDRWRHVALKGQVLTPIHLEPNISKTAGDANAIWQQSLITG